MGSERGDNGLSSGAGLVAIAAGLVLVAVLLVVGMNAFGGSGGAHGSSILSSSTAESQLKLCSEGRDSTYGNPPSQVQQAKCLDQLAGQIAGGGASLPGSP
jgi:hypothetical protein